MRIAVAVASTLMHHEWLTTVQAWLREGMSVVVVTVLGVRGSAPVAVGTRMLVGTDRQFGTVGGGRLEQELLAHARAWLAGSPPPAPLAELGLGMSLGQCCGGKVVVHYELFEPVVAPLVVFGAGHVGQELVPLLCRLGRSVVCIDSRAEWLQRLPALQHLEAREDEDPVAAVASLPVACACLVLTHRHDLDLQIARALLMRGDSIYVGVIGSATKGQRMRTQLKRRSLDLHRFECPVGKPVGKLPAAIAMAMATRLCEVLYEDATGATVADKAALRLLSELVRETTQ